MAIVVNKYIKSLIIPELKKIIPGNGETYIVPDKLATKYEKYLYVIPDHIAQTISDMKEKIRETNTLLSEKKQNLDSDNGVLFEVFKRKEKKREVEYEKQWKKNSRQKKYLNQKLDVLYTFHFGDDEIESALGRLKQSINSLKSQDVSICVINTSKKCIGDELSKDIRYLHHDTNKPFCKAYSINFGVDNLVNTEYFLNSDIDLIYPESFIKNIRKYLAYPIPVRLVFNNHNLCKEANTSTFEECKVSYDRGLKDMERENFGIAPGNGLIHTKSFQELGGYDETFIGYGPEDADFNNRIAYINKYIEVNSVDFNTYHLFHEIKMNYSDYSNNEYYQKREKERKELFGLPIFKIFRRTHFNLEKIKSLKTIIKE